MQLGIYMEVLFKYYCPKCEHFEKKGNEEPCSTCLEKPKNLYSQKPVKFEEVK